MKWIFLKKNEQCSIALQKADGTKMDFSYIDMMKELYVERKIEEPEFVGNFTDGEQESIKVLVDEINSHTQVFFEQAEKETTEV